MATVKVFRGDTWQRAWVIAHEDGSVVDLTGVTARLHVRNAVGNLVASASTADGRLTIQPTEGRIDLLMPANAMVLTPGNYRFDIEVSFPSGIVRTYEQSALVVLEDMSHD